MKSLYKGFFYLTKYWLLFEISIFLFANLSDNNVIIKQDNFMEEV